MELAKVIITIPKAKYEYIQELEHGNTDYATTRMLYHAVKKGTPLDSNSERAETQAYFAGEAYGWEQGRKALVDDVKAEIEKHQFSREYCINHNIDTAIDMGMVRIILDSIGKGVSE